MSDSEQHGSRDSSDRRRGGGDRGGWQSREGGGSSDGRGFSRGDRGRPDGARSSSRGGGDRGGYGARNDRFGGGRDDRRDSRRDDRSAGRGGPDRGGVGGGRGYGGGSRGEDRRDDRRGARNDGRGFDGAGSRNDRGPGGYRGRDDRDTGGRGPRPDRDERPNTRRDGGAREGWSERRRDDRDGRSAGRRTDDRSSGGRDRPGFGSRDDDRRNGSRGFERGGDRGERRDERRGGYGARDDRGGFRSGDGHRAERRGGGRPDRAWEDRRGDGRTDRRTDGRTDRRGERPERPGQDRQGYGNRGGFRDDRRNDRPERRAEYGAHSRDDRRGGHDDARPRFVAPEIDADVTGRELDRSMHHELKALEPSNAERVAQHLVMAARYLEEDPDFALEHANAAVRKAGRIGVVREAAGVAAYAAGDFALALKELRTHRRISGSQEHLPLMVDSQRALGRADKAMEEATSDAASSLDAGGSAALAIVVSGIHADAGDHEAALAALEIPQLDKNRGFSYSPALFRAYAEALRAVGRGREAMTWERQAVVAEAALGVGQFSEPEIVDLGDDLDEDEARRTVQDAQRRHSAPHPEDTDASDLAPGNDMAAGERSRAGDEGTDPGHTGTADDDAADGADPTAPSETPAAENATDAPARHDGARPAGAEETRENDGPGHDDARDATAGAGRRQDTPAGALEADGRDDAVQAGEDGRAHGERDSHE